MSELDKDTQGKLNSDQYGNTKGNSTTHYLIKLMDEGFKSTKIICHSHKWKHRGKRHTKR